MGESRHFAARFDDAFNCSCVSDDDDNRGYLSGAQWADILISVVLVLMAGLMSGLTMGLLSMDPMNLRIIAKSAPEEHTRTYAKRILPLVKRHHLLLVTLLMANAFCMESLPLFLDRLTGPIGAVVISTTAVLAFGEIIPQAICTRFGLAVGAYTYWFVWILIALLSPVAWPISKLLDCVLGEEEQTLYRRAELKELVGFHSIGGLGEDDSEADSSDPSSSHYDSPRNSYDTSSGRLESAGRSESHDSHELALQLKGTGRERNSEKLTRDEVRIIRGALDLRDKKAIDSMTPWGQCFTLPFSGRMDVATMTRIFESGHSRIPIWREDENDVMGMLLVKQLIMLSPNDGSPISSLHIHRVPMVPSTMSLSQLLGIFQSGGIHLSIVVSPHDHITPLGVITLEDVIEEILQNEIIDETDLYTKKGNVATGRRSRTWSVTAFSPNHPPPFNLLMPPRNSDPQTSDSLHHSDHHHSDQNSDPQNSDPRNSDPNMPAPPTPPDSSEDI